VECEAHNYYVSFFALQYLSPLSTRDGRGGSSDDMAYAVYDLSVKQIMMVYDNKQIYQQVNKYSLDILKMLKYNNKKF